MENLNKKKIRCLSCGMQDEMEINYEEEKSPDGMWTAGYLSRVCPNCKAKERKRLNRDEIMIQRDRKDKGLEPDIQPLLKKY
ncbi:MAG: hypothetical protein ACOC5R_05615 [Elusimicrobiota bacterium]